MTNVLEFKSAMIRKGFTIKKLASAIGLSTTTLSYKINNKREFTSSEIRVLKDILNLTTEERDKIFFGENVDF